MKGVTGRFEVVVDFCDVDLESFFRPLVKITLRDFDCRRLEIKAHIFSQTCDLLHLSLLSLFTICILPSLSCLLYLHVILSSRISETTTYSQPAICHEVDDLQAKDGERSIRPWSSERRLIR